MAKQSTRMKTGRPAMDITGRTFGRLTVVRRAGQARSRAALWLCRCSCGRSLVARQDNLLDGTTQSCGCLRAEVVRLGNEQRHAERQRQAAVEQARVDQLLQTTNRLLPVHVGTPRELAYALAHDPELRVDYERVAAAWRQPGVAASYEGHIAELRSRGYEISDAWTTLKAWVTARKVELPSTGAGAPIRSLEVMAPRTPMMYLGRTDGR